MGLPSEEAWDPGLSTALPGLVPDAPRASASHGRDALGKRSLCDQFLCLSLGAQELVRMDR